MAISGSILCLACRKDLIFPALNGIDVCSRCWGGYCPKCKIGSLKEEGEIWECPYSGCSWWKEFPSLLLGELLSEIWRKRIPRTLKNDKSGMDFELIKKFTNLQVFREALDLILNADLNLEMSLTMTFDLKSIKTPTSDERKLLKIRGEFSDLAVNGYRLRAGIFPNEESLIMLSDACFRGDERDIEFRIAQAIETMTNDASLRREHRELYEVLLKFSNQNYSTEDSEKYSRFKLV